VAPEWLTAASNSCRDWLSAIWQGTDVKDTGNAIARKYEHELIRHQGVYDLAESLGVKIIDEHDGFGVFAEDDGPELQSKLDSIVNYLQSLSAKRFGVPIIIKIKRVFNWASADLLGEVMHMSTHSSGIAFSATRQSALRITPSISFESEGQAAIGNLVWMSVIQASSSLIAACRACCRSSYSLAQARTGCKAS